MNKKLLKILKITIIAIIIVSLVISSIVSQDFHHIDTCEIEHYALCCIIHFAQAIIQLTLAIIICQVASFLIYFFLARLHKEQHFFKQKSLVFQKVQQNE